MHYFMKGSLNGSRLLYPMRYIDTFTFYMYYYEVQKLPYYYSHTLI